MPADWGSRLRAAMGAAKATTKDAAEALHAQVPDRLRVSTCAFLITMVRNDWAAPGPLLEEAFVAICDDMLSVSEVKG